MDDGRTKSEAGVRKISLENIAPMSTGCGLGIRVRTQPLSPRGEELAKERDFRVLEDTRGREGEKQVRVKNETNKANSRAGKKGSE